MTVAESATVAETATATETALARVERLLDRIEALNPRYVGFSTVDAAGARAQAQMTDAAVAQGRWLGLLQGMTVAVKDNIDVAGLRASAGSRLFADRIAKADAPVVERLRQAGAIVMGKAAMAELAFGIRSLDAVAGQCRNPWNPAHITGGSSGGSAVAVALDLCDAALGTDTGGSVRLPAGFCGLTGLRPTRGRVSNRGVVPVSATFDTIGPIARRVEDVARLFVAMSSYDPHDPFSVARAFEAGLLDDDADVTGLRVGLPTNFYFEDVDPEVESAVRSVADALAEAGATIVPVDVPTAEEAHLSATTLIFCDACAVYGDDLDNRRALISDAVFERMTKGRALSGVDYARALRFREAWTAMTRSLFERVDLLLYPTAPQAAPPIDDGAHLADATRHATRFTYGSALAGIPGLSLPCGLTRSGLPIGASLDAAWWNEGLLFRVGRAWQSRTDWHLRRAPGANA